MTAKNTTSSQSLAEALERLRSGGFEVREQGGGRYWVGRVGCAAVLASADGAPRFVATPGLAWRDSIAQLVDKGYQKFWKDGRRSVPALAEELKALHAFERDLRAALGMTSLYNQALGTVSANYVYDRVEGREPGNRHASFD